MGQAEKLKPVVGVAAAVLLRHRRGGVLSAETPRQDVEFLLAQRPVGKVYSGYWEFPGGKVEPGETVSAALVRELQEEMGIAVTEAVPWLHKRYVYPHATVHLNFWRVMAWDGEMGVSAPLEHSAVSWVPLQDALKADQHLSPILPANGPILKGLALPSLLWITQAENVGGAAELARIKKAAQRGGPNALLQIRDHDLPRAERLAFAVAAIDLARTAGLSVVLNARDERDLEDARQLRADGVHLTSAALAQCVEIGQRPDFVWVGASCHTAVEVAQVGELGLDYAVLGPVQKTQTHPDADPLGWPQFAELIQDNRVPVFALGGLQASDLRLAWQAGAHGVALMRGW